MKSYALIAAVMYLHGAQGVCTEPRIRKSWDALRAEGGTDLYIEAVQQAVRLGYQQDFADTHVAQGFAADEAHRQGSFMFWHRRFLLAYENMLRSLGPRYECVTVPYWNYFHESNLLLESGPWTRLLDVSNICNELPAGTARRSNWASFRSFPGIGLASTVRALDVNHFETLSRNIEGTVHNGIHNWLGATMSSYSAPLDPIFFSHHATIDLLHTIYYECKAGFGQSEEFKRTSTIAYHPWGGAPSSESGFRMGRASFRISQFFQELPNQYYEFVDHTDIGEFSYSYQRDSNFNTDMSRMNCLVAPVTADDSSNESDSEPDRFRVNGFSLQSEADGNMASFYDEVLEGCISSEQSRESCKGQVVVAECLCFDKLFGVEDYTDEFRQNFNVPDDEHTECFQSVLDYTKAQEQDNVSNFISIDESVWQGACRKHFGNHHPIEGKSEQDDASSGNDEVSSGFSLLPTATSSILIALYIINF